VELNVTHDVFLFIFFDFYFNVTHDA